MKLAHMMILIILVLLVSGCTQSEETRECPDSCDDENLCTNDYCSNETNYECRYENITPCCGNEICETGEDYQSCTNDCEKPEESDPCENIICNVNSEICPNKFNATCEETCVNGTCVDCTPDCSEHQIIELEVELVDFFSTLMQPADISTDGELFWFMVVGGLYGYKIDSEGNINETYDFGSMSRGMSTHNGDDFFLTKMGNKIEHIKISNRSYPFPVNFESIETISIDNPEITWLGAIKTLNGENFWIVATINNEEKIIEIDKNGVIFNEITLPENVVGEDMETLNGSEFWVLDSQTDKIYHINDEGIILDIFDAYCSIASGVTTTDGKEFWISNSDANRICHIKLKT